MLGSSLLPPKSEILPFATQQDKIPGLILYVRQSHLHWVSSLTFLTIFFVSFSYKSVVIFDFKEEGTGTEDVAIATLKCVPSGMFLRV